jgi:hypothetical protein
MDIMPFSRKMRMKRKQGVSDCGIHAWAVVCTVFFMLSKHIMYILVFAESVLLATPVT